VRKALRAAALLIIAPVVVCACGSGLQGDPFFSIPVAEVQVTAAGSTTLTSIGATVQLQAAATDLAGNAVLSTTYTWASSDEAVVTVNSLGLATAVGAGPASVSATTGSVLGSIELTVSLPVATR